MSKYKIHVCDPILVTIFRIFININVTNINVIDDIVIYDIFL